MNHNHPVTKLPMLNRSSHTDSHALEIKDIHDRQRKTNINEHKHKLSEKEKISLPYLRSTLGASSTKPKLRLSGLSLAQPPNSLIPLFPNTNTILFQKPANRRVLPCPRAWEGGGKLEVSRPPSRTPRETRFPPGVTRHRFTRRQAEA